MIVLLVALVVGGLLLRLWILGNAPLNSDEATAGLVAHEIARGHFFAFYWGQSYGGVEPYVLALSFRVAGQSPLTLNGTPVVLALIGSVLVWRIGLHLFPRPAALVAAVLSWIWSESTLWNSTKEYGFHQVCDVLGLIVLLQAVRIVVAARTAHGDRLSDWFFLGGAIGLGYWASPEIVYFALPGTVVVLVALRHRAGGGIARRLVAMGAAAVIGATPAIWAAATGHGTAIPSSPATYLSRLGTFFSHVLPMILGLRIEGAGAWELGDRFGPVAYALVLVVVGAAAVARRRGQPRRTGAGADPGPVPLPVCSVPDLMVLERRALCHRAHPGAGPRGRGGRVAGDASGCRRVGRRRPAPRGPGQHPGRLQRRLRRHREPGKADDMVGQSQSRHHFPGQRISNASGSPTSTRDTGWPTT